MSLTTDKRKNLDAIIQERGYTDYKWVDPQKFVVSQWVRMKCKFGCGEYGRGGACPPQTPSVSECSQFFNEYSDAVILHFEGIMDKPEDRHNWSRKINAKLVKLEREVFLCRLRTGVSPVHGLVLLLQGMQRRPGDVQRTENGPPRPGSHGRGRLLDRPPFRFFHQRAHRIRPEDGPLCVPDGTLTLILPKKNDSNLEKRGNCFTSFKNMKRSDWIVRVVRI